MRIRCCDHAFRVRGLVLITVHHSSVRASSGSGRASYFNVTSHERLGQIEETQNNLKHWRLIMKTLVSALVALSVIAGIASAPASALDARHFYDQRDTAGIN